MGLRMHFIAIEIVVLKHLVVTLSELHPVYWAYMKVYQYW